MAEPLGHELDYERLYEFRFQGIDHDARRKVWAQIAPFIWERMGRPSRVLDPAGGFGEFINSVPASERWLVDVVDYPERTTAPGVKIVIGDIFDVELPLAHFEGVFASNLLEHLRTPEDVSAFLNRMRETLAPGGTIAIMGPNFKYCAREYFDCADHHLALTEVSVQEHLAAAGYEVRRVVPRFLPLSFRGHLPPSPRLTALYLRLPVVWRVFGKQFLITATAR
jgi:hypothetical protein